MRSDFYDVSSVYDPAILGFWMGNGISDIGQCDPTVDPTCGTPGLPICEQYVTCPDGSVVCPSMGESCPTTTPTAPPTSGPASGLGCDPTQAGCNYQCPNGVWTSDMSLCPTEGSATGLGCDPDLPGCNYMCDNGTYTSDMSLCPSGTGSGSGGGTPVGSGTPSNPASAASQVGALGSFLGGLIKTLTGTGAPPGYHYVGTTLVPNVPGLSYGATYPTLLSGTINSSTLWLIILIGGFVVLTKK
jgi:hypothetical protein